MLAFYRLYPRAPLDAELVPHPVAQVQPHPAGAAGDPDVDFAMMMRMHHQGANDMANAEMSNGKDPQMKKMAKAIVSAQKKEIAQFDAYLAKHGNTAHKMSK